ncbi:MAG: phosphate--acyl-ACP acyltransferase, partial [Eubacterium sp.]|nr:phosphate--acyl-ACP acyltransferase [Eubacterium sp.]
MKIIVDAFGGDNAPLEIIKGAMLAVEEYNVDIILVGNKSKISDCIENNNIKLKNTEIVDAECEIAMCDDAKSVLKEKANSSLGVAFRLLANGDGDALVSAGSTGAITVGATFLAKRIKGVKRPCIASVMPSAEMLFLLMDCGANAECRAEFLVQFGLMGSL